MMTDTQRAGLVNDCNEAFEKEIAALPTLVSRVVRTKYAIGTHVPRAVQVTTANGIQVEPGEQRPIIKAEDRAECIEAAVLCGKSIIAAVHAARLVFPDLPLVYAENWSLSVQFASRDDVECCCVDIRGAVLPEIMVEQLPDHRPGAAA